MPAPTTDTFDRPANSMTLLRQARAAAGTLLALTALTGVLYPLGVTALARLAFASSAGGSLVVVEGRIVGSELIGQPFGEERYFWGRPSATTPTAYNAAASRGSNLGPSSDELAASVAWRVQALRQTGSGFPTGVPVDLVTASGSGLDPHISPAAAEAQVDRVARARGLSPGEVRGLVAELTQGRRLGFLGEPRVNVLLLNLALDAME